MGSESGSGRIASLDILRLLACAAVIVEHGNNRGFYTAIPWLSRFVRSFGLGELAVEVFFCLSGFLITRILLRDREAGIPLRHFLAKRSLRIFPAYYALLLFAWIRHEFFGGTSAVVHWSSWVYGLNLVIWADPSQATKWAMNHSWSLCIEEQFYLIWPFIVVLLPRARSLKVMLYLVMPLSLVSIAALQYHPSVLKAATLTHFLTLGAGAVMAYQEGWVRSAASRPLGTVLVLCGLAMRWPTIPLVGTATVLGERQLAAVAISAGVLLLALSSASTCRNRLLAELGMMSYGIYLWQSSALFWGRRVDPGLWGLFWGVLFTMLVATASYLLIERPLIQWAGRRFCGRQPAAVAVPATA